AGAGSSGPGSSSLTPRGSQPWGSRKQPAALGKYRRSRRWRTRTIDSRPPASSPARGLSRPAPEASDAAASPRRPASRPRRRRSPDLLEAPRHRVDLGGILQPDGDRGELARFAEHSLRGRQQDEEEAVVPGAGAFQHSRDFERAVGFLAEEQIAGGPLLRRGR